ncbi:MAG: hypothetical protein K0S39_3945 [Paenibacillus sp.]|jgi:hypothetical protein|nr:hypothetical protein [Paenibacillus sp.]
MFTERYVNDKLARLIIPIESYKPYPDIEDRSSWEALPASIRDKWISAGEQYVGYDWPTLPAVRYMDFVRNGNRTRFQKPYFDRREALARLVIAECMENKGRFVDEIINGIWSISEESYWVVPAHKNASIASYGDALPDVTDPVVDLFAAETASLFAWTHYLIKPRLEAESRLVTKRIQYEVKRRILDPYLERDDFGWMGFSARKNVNNWNPWINSNMITSFLLLEEDTGRRIEGIKKTLRSLDVFMNIHHSDGGCDEGPGYWSRAGASLFDCLELLYSASGGVINLYGEPLIKEIGRYIYRAHIHNDYYVNFADGDARLNIDADVVYRFGCRIEDDKMAALGANAYRKGGEVKRLSLLRAIPAIFNEEKLAAAPCEPPLVRDVWLDGIEFMAAREQEGSAQGLFLAAKGGHNNESHNHNDVGQFIVYANGKPFLIDIGVEEYISKTFSPRRYEIWTMQSVYHNLPAVDGVHQQAGRDYKATDAEYHSNDDLAQLSLNIAAAYPEEAGIESWKRTYRLHRGKEAFIEILEDFKLHRESGDISLSLMTVCKPQLSSAGTIVLQNEHGEQVQLEYDEDLFAASSESIAIEDQRLRRVWGNELFRILLKSKAPVSNGNWAMTIRM